MGTQLLIILLIVIVTVLKTEAVFQEQAEKDHEEVGTCQWEDTSSRPLPSCENGCILLFLHTPKTGGTTLFKSFKTLIKKDSELRCSTTNNWA